MRRALRTGLAAALALGAPLSAPRSASAQELRSVDISRQLHDSAALQVRVNYAAGKLALRSAQLPVLYRVQLSYLPERVEPRYSFDAATRTLHVGVEKRGSRVPGEGRPGEMHLDLAPAVPVDLALELGAVEADLDLSGLRVGRLRVESGASDATVHFDAPNPERMRSLEFEVGAASLRATRLANANAPEIRVQAGVGSVDLDFGGKWTQDVDVSVQVALGGVKIRVPSDVGVRVEARKFLASFDTRGLIKRGDAYYSENWDTAAHHLRLRTRTTFGKLELEPTDRE
ncbi:MAG: LiaF domain-containing protein [Gemmatimonadaceae bacterium]